MGSQPSFLSREKKRQAKLKTDPVLFSSEALANGPYSPPSLKRPNPPSYEFCLPVNCAAENLFGPARSQLDKFASRRIPWHKGWNGGPTTHLCSSQICCVNFLASFAQEPEALLTLVAAVYPDAERMVPVDEASGSDYVQFEWIGNPRINYLDEAGKSGVRTPGANCTSADAAVRYADFKGAEHVVLIEWKFCESYRDLGKMAPERRLLSVTDGEPTKSARKRRSRYEARLADLVKLPAGVAFDDLCVEPLYQLMRQQLLAHEMETKGKEAASVSVLHLSPRANRDFPRITSPAVRLWATQEFPAENLGVCEAWSRLTAKICRFRHVAIEAFFAPALKGTDDGLAAWRTYIAARYPWVGEPHD